TGAPRGRRRRRRRRRGPRSPGPTAARPATDARPRYLPRPALGCPEAVPSAPPVTLRRVTLAPTPREWAGAKARRAYAPDTLLAKGAPPVARPPTGAARGGGRVTAQVRQGQRA